MKLTCNRKDGYVRAALWCDGKITDLYIDSIEKPDLSGALVCASLGRIMSGGKAGWFDAGLEEKFYVESKEVLQAGVTKQLRVLTSFSNGKACRAEIVDDGAGEVGLLEAAPMPWQRALRDVEGKQVECVFSDQDDMDACQVMYVEDALISISTLSESMPDMDEAIDELDGSHVPLSSGGEIVIEPTEALVAIDVNADQARNTLSVNLAAMHEVARQIRLRNLGGIIVIDALKMPSRADNGKVLSVLKRACSDDPAGVVVFGMTKLGLIEITRRRQGLSLMEMVDE